LDETAVRNIVKVRSPTHAPAMSDYALQQSTKSPRTDGTTSGSHLLQRGDPWLDDGNVILQADSKQFRVHRSVLSASSAIFKDMFTLSTADKVLVEGCPVVHLSDAADDLHHVLKAIYERSYHFIDREPLPISIIAAFLRLGQKYEIDQLRSEAVTRLSYDFPTTLEEFDQSFKETLSHCDGVLLFTSINLARECNLLSVLPSALYACSNTMAVQDILRGVLLDDGTRCIMSPVDQEGCITGWFTLLEKQATKTLKWVDPRESFAGCTNPQGCDAGRSTLLRFFWHPVPKLFPLIRWDPIFDSTFCSFCSQKSREIHEAGRQSVWNEIPSIFGLPEWEELRKQ